MQIVIVGAGAIGRLFGALFSKEGHEVIFVEPREEIVDAINQQGIGVIALGVEDPDAVTMASAKAVTDGQSIRKCDLVIMAVKSFDTLAAIKSVAHLVTKTSPVVTIQTGLGNLETMEKVVSRQDIIGGFTLMAATALGPGKVKHGGQGKTSIGELDGRITPRVEKISKLFNDCGIAAEAIKQIVGQLWCKVIVYSAINPVSAILRTRNGQLLEKMESVTLMKRLIDEGVAVAEASAVDLVCHDLYDLLFEACRNTYNNLSTMLQDFLNEKRTEIDYQNGALCRYGAKHGIVLPTHHTIIQIIKLLERWGRNFDYPE